LRRDNERLEKAGLRVVLISMGTPQEAKKFRESLNLPYTVLCDPERLSYRAYDLGHMSLSSELTLDSALSSVREAARHGVGSAGSQNPTQLGGGFVVGKDGTVRYVFRARRMADRVDASALERAAKS